MIDFAGSYLPGFIGGEQDISVCTEKIRNLCSAGVDTMILTPRYYPAKLGVAEFIARRDKAIAGLVPGKKRFPKIIPGCEVYIDERLKYISEIGKLAVKGTRTIIADMPAGIWESALLDTLYGIQIADYEVLISHIDRYPVQYAEDLFKLGYRGLIDISAFCGIANIFRCKRYFEWIDKGYIVGVGSNFEHDEKRAHEKTLKLPRILGEERMKMLAERGGKILK